NSKGLAKEIFSLLQVATVVFYGPQSMQAVSCIFTIRIKFLDYCQSLTVIVLSLSDISIFFCDVTQAVEGRDHRKAVATGPLKVEGLPEILLRLPQVLVAPGRQCAKVQLLRRELIVNFLEL